MHQKEQKNIIIINLFNLIWGDDIQKQVSVAIAGGSPQPALTSLHMHSRYQCSPMHSVGWSISSEVQPTAKTTMNSSLSFNIQPVPGTIVVADVAFSSQIAEQRRQQKQEQHEQQNKEKKPLQRLNLPLASIRTSRQMANGTFLMAALAGSLANRQAWSASLISYRNSLIPSSKPKNASMITQDNGQKLKAAWRIGFSPLNGQLRYLLVSLKNLVFPCWRIRLSLSSAYPLKVSYQWAEDNTFYLSYSWAYVWSRIKLVRLQSFVISSSTDTNSANNNNINNNNNASMEDDTEWNLKYWLKYDGRDEDDDYVMIREATNKHNAPYYDAMRNVAVKKRELESAAPNGGLIILEANSWMQESSALIFDSKGTTSTKSNRLYEQQQKDMTDILQYWVIDSKMQIPFQQPTG